MDTKPVGKLEVEEFIKESPLEWKYQNGRLTLDYVVDDFDSALKLFNLIAARAQQLNHHPDICIKDYSHVDLSFCTHSIKGISNLDLQLAGEIYNLTLESA